jgi:mono/diheme cytochrome c family protein
MNFQQLGACGTAFVAFIAATQAKLPPEELAKLPAPAATTVDFARDVKPIFDAACVKCHGKGKNKGGLSLETRETFLKGGDSGAAILPGKSAESLLIELVSGLNPDSVMPQKGSKLKAEQVALLRAWIDQGANWPAEITFKKAVVNNLHPRKPELPPVKSGAANPVDRLLAPTTPAIISAQLVDDRVFARRAYLDLIGVLPTPLEQQAFLADKAPAKRARLVSNLLSDKKRYAEHWLTFWNDLLRNDYRGTGYIDGGRKQISSWLFSAMFTNLPYDKFVTQLVNPTPESEGFINGITWRGAVNASQKPPMQAAQSVGQVFMGVNLKCASCHDSFINDYTLADSYGIAAIFATNDLEIAECDKPTGKNAKVKFLYSELGDIDSSLSKTERTKRLAEILTSKQDGRLTRTIVNRLWAKFMGRGLVEPVDEMDAPAWNPDLLDWLAEDLAENGYDLKRTMRWILTSRAYQLPAVSLGEQSDRNFVFTGPAIRRMSAEQFRDAMGALTGVWYEKPASTFDFSGGKDGGRLPKTAKWIWSEAGAENKALAENVYVRKTFTVDTLPEQASAAIACDNSFVLWVNGKQAASGNDFAKPNFVDLKPHLRTGENVIAIQAANHTPDNKAPKADQPPKEIEANPAGLIFAARLRGPEPMEIVSDASWHWSKSKSNGWEKVKFDAAEWQKCVELGSVDMAPWALASKLEGAMSLADVHGAVRASLVAADPLMLALGRPNREQVMTTRQSTATTLQALEMTNGDTLNKVLKRGAEKLLADTKLSTDELVEQVFVKSLGRAPNGSERKLATELVGSPAKPEGVEDLLWSVAMLPEFQLIY